MKQTSNYQLPQWEESDRIMMKDFNGAMEKIDGGLTTKCEMVMGTFNPGGLYEKTPYHVSLGFRPRAVLIWYNIVSAYSDRFDNFAIFNDGYPIKIESLDLVLAEVEDDGFWVQGVRNGSSSYNPYLVGNRDYLYIALK